MVLMVLALTGTTHAFEPLRTAAGDPISWPAGTIDIAINPDNPPSELSRDEALEALHQSFEEWTYVSDAAIEFNDLGYTSTDQTQNDGRNVVYFEPEWEWDNDILALTSTWSTSRGNIVGFDIRINTETTFWGIGGMDLQNAMTHEVGHALGLDHSPEVLDATMFPSTSAGETKKRDLHSDDEDGAAFLYPLSAEPPPGCSTTPATGLLALLLMLPFTRRKEVRR